MKDIDKAGNTVMDGVDDIIGLTQHNDNMNRYFFDSELESLSCAIKS